MATHELSVDAAYLSGDKGWGPEEGIREIIQNGHDACIEHGGELKVEHANDRLVVENTGCKLQRQALLIGCSSKRDRHDTIGKWGEGLKFGALALVRAGHKMTIRTGPEVWTPFIGESDAFGGASVLKVKIEGGREDRRRVRVEIEGISKEFWDGIKDRFLFLYKREIPQVECDDGSVLTSEKFKGRIYVKGIFVQSDSKLAYGYNLFNVDLDRDRRLIHSYDLGQQTRKVWAQALNRQPELASDFYKMLDRRAPDVEGFYWSGADGLPEAAIDQVAAAFLARYGADAIPVETLEISKEMVHFGKSGIVVSKSMLNVLSQRLQTAEQVKASMADEVVRTYSWDELTAEERANLVRATDLVTKAVGTPISTYVVDFRDPGLNGLGRPDIKIARKVLASRSETLRVLIHEHAHAVSGADDGEKLHVATIEATWAAVSEVLCG
jgi:hypothetical protein